MRHLRFHRLWPATALLLATVAAAGNGGSFNIDWSTIDCGGGVSTAGDVDVAGTIGQADAGVMTGGSFTLAGGFWNLGGTSCIGDVDGSGDVGFPDVLAVLAAWGPCDGGCPADVNGDGAVDFADLLTILGAWGACA